MTAPLVAVAGGGPAGATAALVLARHGLRVLVLEAGPSGSGPKAGECLPPSLNPLLRDLGLEDLLAGGGHLRSLGNRFVWGSPIPGERPFLAGTRGDGWHVDRQTFEAGLAARAVAAGADWRWGHRLLRCEPSGDGWRLEIGAPAGREAVEAAFVADATGRPARLARRRGARRVRYDRLVGAAALLRSSTPAADTYTLVEAVPEGWWYSALLAGGGLAVAFLTDGDLLLGRRGAAAWWRGLEETRETRARVAAHGYRLREAPRLLPAETSRLDRIAGPGWLAVGDAAAAYDPLSSYGIGSAMASGFYAGQAIASSLAGRPEEARDAYLQLLQDAYGACLDLQRHHYAQERRWPEAPFWRRRREAGYCLEPLAAGAFTSPSSCP